MNIAISVENLSKAYRIGKQVESSNSLIGEMLSLAASPIRNFRNLASLNTFGNIRNEESLYWALRDVSFDVAEGEVVGIIGRNGAGKSTLLKILSRITLHTTGRAVLRGRVSSLLEVGTGFHQELSGRENVYMNGTILGMKKREINRKFDEIVAFSGIEKFLDTPVKRYSSGMKVRLAFAVAAHLEPEILIIDEVLAVGDQEFQRKCLGKMNDVAKSGRTIFFVSHNMAAVDALCSRCIVLDQGRVLRDCETQEAVQVYAKLGSRNEENDSNRQGKSGLLQKVVLRSTDGDESQSFGLGEDIVLEVDVITNSEVQRLALSASVHSPRGECMFTLNPRFQSSEVQEIDAPTKVRCTIQNIRLTPGIYSIDLYAKHGNKILDEIEGTSFEIYARDVYGTGRLIVAGGKGIIQPEVSWAKVSPRVNEPLAGK
jgi:lipopolysaccharide transport system ATP-binding protein